jgi:predicted metal-dependent hydrolase
MRRQKDLLQFKNNKEFSADLLYSQLFKIFDQIKKEGKIEVFGDLDFEVVEKIDNKKQRIAKLKGNKILVKINAAALPKSALKYIIVHEMAHIFTKRHTKRFWKTVETIYPNFKIGQKLFMEYGKFLKLNCSSIA